MWVSSFIALEISLVTKVGNLMHITCLLICPQLIAGFARALVSTQYSCFCICVVFLVKVVIVDSFTCQYLDSYSRQLILVFREELEKKRSYFPLVCKICGKSEMSQFHISF